MSVDGGPEYPATTDLSEATTGSLALAEEPIAFDVDAIRADFPILERTVGAAPLVYLDSANSSQKPRVVVEAVEDHYLNHNANVARAMHVLGAEATEAFEGARAQLAKFIGANRSEEVVFTKNASEALNLCAYTLGASLRPGDEIVISVMEHHSNIVPWQLLAQRTGATLRWFDVTDEGRLDLEKAAAEGLVNERTKIISVAYVSNVLGTINPISQIAALGHAVGATVVVDASQAVPQLPVNMTALGADLVAFTGHKMVGPTGIGVLWGRYEILAALPPFLGGGEMIEIVTMEGSTYAPPPHRFEAGTPPIAQAVGLAAAAQYLTAIGMDQISAHEREITEYALQGLGGIRGLKVLGPAQPVDRGGAVSFTLITPSGEQIHPHDVSQLLDSRGIAVRAGHHCARPLHERFGVQSSTRASFYLYTTHAEIDALIDGLDYTSAFFGGLR
jgi:cysteine desulfurase / selenocysteine lyase